MENLLYYPLHALHKEEPVLIQLDVVNYDNLSNLGMKITQYVNGNLRDIIRVLIDVLETDSEFELDGFFPRDYLMRKPQECRNIINEPELFTAAP